MHGTDTTKEAIGLDIGGLRIKAAHVRIEHGQCSVVSHKVVVRGNDELTEDGMVHRLAELVEELDNAGSLPVGVGVAGIVRTGGIVVRSPNYPAFRDFALKSTLTAMIGRSVVVDNDANSFLVGEHTAGAVEGQKDVLAVTLGTGLGGALLQSGRLVRGVRGMAGEIGHVRFVQDGALCGCGARGCAEQYMSTQFLQREASERNHSVVHNVEMVEIGRALASAARKGDRVSQDIFAQMGRNLGLHLGGIANILDPKTVLLGGGLASCHDLFKDALTESLAEYAYDHIADDLEVVSSKLGDQAGCVGAAALAIWEQNNGLVG